MKIGLDFDNTIAAYDHVFSRLPVEWGWLSAQQALNKTTVRDQLRQQPNGEKQWQQLQGQVYGKYMPEARLFDGVIHFLNRCEQQQIPVFIISHKTEYGHFDQNKINLRDAASAWLEQQGLTVHRNFAINPAQVYFKSTRQAKLKLIRDLQITHYVDDLLEVLIDDTMPGNVRRLWFSPNEPVGRVQDESICLCQNWAEVEQEIFNNA